jgi:hypothetical protein
MSGWQHAVPKRVSKIVVRAKDAGDIVLELDRSRGG